MYYSLVDKMRLSFLVRTIQWQNENRRKDKQPSTKHYKEYWPTRIKLKTGVNSCAPEGKDAFKCLYMSSPTPINITTPSLYGCKIWFNLFCMYPIRYTYRGMGWMYVIIGSHFVPLEGNFLLIALVIVRITLNVIVRQIPLRVL